MNKKQIILYLGAFAAICLPRPSFAAESPPEPPLLAVVADPCAWTIDVQYATPRKSPDSKQAKTAKRLMDIYPLMIRETVEKAGPNWHREKLFDNRTKENVWVYKGTVLFQFQNFPPDKVTALPINDPVSPVKSDFGPDFPDLDWIRPEVFVKTVTYHGQNCHFYEDKEVAPLDGGDALKPSTANGRRAWIDVKTRLPVAVEDDVMLKRYSFLKDPSPSIEPSGIFATAYQATLRRPNTPGNILP